MSAAMETFLDILVCILLVSGTLFMVLGAVGLLRLPDVYTRMQAAAKTTTLGFALVVLAAIPSFGSLDVVVRALVAVAFLYLTAPIAAHAIARAARRTGCRLWSGSVIDEMDDTTGAA